MINPDWENRPLLRDDASHSETKHTSWWRYFYTDDSCFFFGCDNKDKTNVRHWQPVLLWMAFLYCPIKGKQACQDETTVTDGGKKKEKKRTNPSHSPLTFFPLSLLPSRLSVSPLAHYLLRSEAHYRRQVESNLSVTQQR